MRKINIIKGLLFAAILLFAVCFGSFVSFVSVVKATDNGTVFGDGTFSYSEKVDGLNLYGGCNLCVIDGAEAENAGVPKGYTENVNVLKMESIHSFGMDVVFDFSVSEYQRAKITGISIKFYIESTSSDDAKYPDFRIPVPNDANRWVTGGQGVATKTNEWITLELTDKQIDLLCVDDTLKAFVVCLRTNEETVMYIDEVKVSLAKVVEDNPIIVLPYDKIYVSEGAYPAEIKATDSVGECEVIYSWSKGALDERGRLKVGTHNCTVIAIGTSGNRTEKTVTYIVDKEETDTIYKITFKAEGMNDVIIEYTEESIEYIKLPSVPEKEHYDSYWEDFTFEKRDDQTVNCIYIPQVCEITFVAGDRIVKTLTYTIEDMSDFKSPEVPEKYGYFGKWEKYELDFKEKIVNCIYLPKVCEVKFVVDGEIVEILSYTVDSLNEFKAPEVPEKEGYIGKWEEYKFDFENVTVKAVYEKKTDSSECNGSGCSSSISENSVMTMIVLYAAALLFVGRKKKS